MFIYLFIYLFVGLVIANHQDVTWYFVSSYFYFSGNVNINKLDFGTHEDMSPPLSTKM